MATTLRQTFSDIADAMRAAGTIGETETVRPVDMADAVREAGPTFEAVSSDKITEIVVNTIRPHAFYALNNLKTVHSNAPSVGESAFSTSGFRSAGQGLRTFTSSCDFDISVSGFGHCPDLDWASFPWDKVVSMGGSVFNLDSTRETLTRLVDTITMPKLKTIDGSSLNYWRSRRLDMPNVETVGSITGGSATTLEEIRADNLVSTGVIISSSNGWNLLTLHCPKLTSFYGIGSSPPPKMRYIGNTLDASGNPAWTDLSNVEIIKSYIAYYCPQIVWKHKWCYLPKLTQFSPNGGTFRNCSTSNMRGVWIGPNDTTSGFGTYSFYNCPNQLKVFLPRTSKIYTNGSGSSYNSFAKVYVPTSLLDEYKNATNWAGMTSKIEGLTDAQFAAVEQQIKDGVDADAIVIPAP